MVSSQLVVIGSGMRIASIFSKALYAGQFAYAVADFDASRQAFLHAFGIVSIQRSGRFGKNLVSAGTHGVDHVFILVEVQRRLDSSCLFFVFKNSD